MPIPSGPYVKTMSRPQSRPWSCASSRASIQDGSMPGWAMVNPTGQVTTVRASASAAQIPQRLHSRRRVSAPARSIRRRTLSTLRNRLAPLNYERIYEYRFRDIDQASRAAVWSEIAPHVHGLMGHPETVLDPAAGRGEFICAIPAGERWAVDEVAYPEAERDPGVRSVTSRIMDAELPEGHFDGVFVSNFLEHLH